MRGKTTTANIFWRRSLMLFVASEDVYRVV